MTISDEFGQPSQSYWTQQTYLVNSGISVRGILGTNGSEAKVDPKCFIGRPFWHPVRKMLDMQKPIAEINIHEFADLGECDFEISSKDHMMANFDADNAYDIEKIWKDRDRIGFAFSGCPMNSIYCIQEKEDLIKVVISPYSKTYFYIEDYEWLDFLSTIDESVAEIREAKLGDILGDHQEAHSNIIRKAKFMSRSDQVGHRSRDFVSSVLEYYDKNGKITERQAEALKNAIKK